MRFLFPYNLTVRANPFFLFELYDGGRDGTVMAELMPGRVAPVAEDYLVGIGRVATTTVDAYGCFTGFSALLRFL